ncbi:MAG: T9SS type A sorting domain-containing protein [Saprospiraceae bacterium]
MRYSILLIFLILIVSIQIDAQTCLSGGINFTSQRNIDDFSVNYPNCTIIDGDVEIYPTSGISNLEGLRQIEQVNGNLTIIFWDDLENFEGLNNLESIGGNLRMDYLHGLEDFSGLENLQSIGGSFAINENSTFTDFRGLNGLKYIGLDLVIQRCDSLQNLNGLDSLQFVGRSFNFFSNNYIDTLSGLEQLKEITDISISSNTTLSYLSLFTDLDSLLYDLEIGANPNLEEIAGFDSLSFTGGRLNIQSNSSLKKITGLTNLQTTGEFRISNNNQLINLDSFQSLSIINGNFFLSSNDSIVNIKGLKNLSTVNGAFFINFNDLLSDLSGLENLTFVERFVSIAWNPMLENISALKNLQHISEGLSISHHPRLKTLDGLEKIPATNGPLYINHNDSLTDLSAIANYDPTAITELIIRENPKLEICDITSICQLLRNPLERLIIFQNNGSGCLDRQTVAIQCDVAYTPPISSTKSINWNWSSHIKRTVGNAETYPLNLFQDSQRNNYLVGTFASDVFFNDKLLPFSGDVGVRRNYFIAKYDANGEVIWAKDEHIEQSVFDVTIDEQDIIHVFATSPPNNNTVYHKQYDTDWNQLSSVPILNYTIRSSGSFTRTKMAIDKIGNQYFFFRGDGSGTINIRGLVDTLELLSPFTNWVLKYTPEGELAWLDTIKSGGFHDYEIAFNEQNELTLAGYYAKTLTVQGTNLQGNGGSTKHIFCLQYNTDGSLKWARTFGDGGRIDYCNDLVIKDNFVYITGTLGYGDYYLGNDTISVARNDPYLFKLDGNGAIVDYLVLPLNTAPSKGASIAFNEANELVWIGKYSGNDARIQEIYLPHESSSYFQQHLFLLTLDESDGFDIKSIHTIETNGTYEIPEIIAIEDNAFLAAGYFSQEILLGDTTFTTDFSVSNIYDVFMGTFSIMENCKENYVLDNTETSTDQTIPASQTITSTRQHLDGNVRYTAGESITLMAGFEVAFGVEFSAKIESCTPAIPMVSEVKNNLMETALVELQLNELKQQDITIFPNPTNDYFSITGLKDWSINEIKLHLFNLYGESIELLIADNVDKIDVSHLPKGIYILSVDSPKKTLITKKIVVQ